MLGLLGACKWSLCTLKTLNGSDSRLPPQTLLGARARTEASVSIERLRRRFEDEARVRMDASSDSRLFAVALEYVVGLPVGARCGGNAEAGPGETGY